MRNYLLLSCAIIFSTFATAQTYINSFDVSGTPVYEDNSSMQPSIETNSEHLLSDTTSTSSIIGITIEVGITINPNPVNTVGTINLSISKFLKLSLKLYDLNGKLIKTIVSNKGYMGGKYSISFDATNIPSGMYMLALEGFGIKVTTKLGVVH